MTESIRTEDHPEPSRYSENTILGMTGYTFSIAIVFIAAYSPLLATKTTNTPVMHGITHGFMFLAMVVFYFLMSRHINNRDMFIRSRMFRIVFAILQALLPITVLCEKSFGLVLPAAPLMVLWLALGVSIAYFSCSWVDVQSNIGEEHVRHANLWSFGVAGCIAAAVLAMPASTGVVVFILLCAGSLFLLLNAPAGSTEEMSERDEKWFAENSKYSVNGSYIMIVDGMMIGIIAGLLVARVSKNVIPSFTMGLAFICVAVVFLILEKKRPSLLALGRSQLVFLPVLVGCLILSGFLEAPWNTVASLPLFVVLYLFDYTNSSVLSLRGNILAISPCFCYSKGRIFIVLGQMIGWFSGAFLASGIGKGSLSIVSVILVILVCIYITAATIYPDKYPIINEGAIHHIDPAIINRPAPEPLIERPYKRKCAHATAAYDLTPREGEILFFLAKGRNAKYISDQLYVAERTVKTHIYHIYQKMGIHSQQELIDIVEEENS